MATCRQIATSEEYGDFIVNYSGENDRAVETFGGQCFQRISGYYGIIYKSLAETGSLSIRNYSFGSIPALYGLMERDIGVRSQGLETALENAGVLRLQNQPVLQLKGQGCIMAFIDTGINIEDNEFRYGNGDTRIIRLWDMTDDTGNPPKGILYGSEYTEEDINMALREGMPANGRYMGHDSLNHGNVLARISAGNTGAAPEAYIVVVKLKEAKKYLKDYYFIRQEVPAYQENDIMLAVNYIKGISLALNLPVSLCIALGSNGRSHDGRSALSYILDRFVSSTGAVAVLSAGDEGNRQLHFSGTVKKENVAEAMEIRVDERQKGLTVNIWGDNPQIFSVGIVSPTGESIPRVPARIGKSEIYQLIFDNTTVTIEYELVEGDSGDELILISLNRPTAGVWTINIYGDNILYGSYNAYLPISQFIYENTYFLKPDPEITITDPAYARQIITTTTYNASTNALYISNGRGFARDSAIKPDLASPLSCGITAGASCQFLTWGIVDGNDKELRCSDIKSYLIRGAVRREDITYPSREWGYGALNVYEAFERLRGD